MTRIEALRSHFEPPWSQGRMAQFLGVDQSAVCRIENGQAESGPVSRLLDLLSAAIEAGRISKTMAPAEAVAALNAAKNAAE